MSGFHCSVAKRPYFHLLANCFWQFNFDYKKDKTNREYFLKFFKDRMLSPAELDREYDEVLDIVTQQMLKEWYKNGEPEVLDTVKVFVNEEEYKSDYTKKIEQKLKFDLQNEKKAAEDEKWDKINSRSGMSIQDLLQNAVYDEEKKAKK